MENKQKNDFSLYTRDQLLQIIENKDQEIDFVWSELNFYINWVSVFLVILGTLIVIVTLFT